MTSGDIRVMRVQIKWKLVAAALFALLLLAIFIYVFTHGESCSSYHDAPEMADLIDYCNFPQRPAEGMEGDVPTSGPDAYTLRAVYVVIRHGDRSAMHSVPGMSSRLPFSCRFTSSLLGSVPGLSEYFRAIGQSSGRGSEQTYSGYAMYPNSAACDTAELTPEGAAQQFRNGRFMRRAYVDRHRLLTGEQAAKQVLVRGTTYSRTFQSAVAFLYGLLPPSASFDISKFSFEMAANNTMCTRAPCACAAVHKYLDAFSSTFRQSARRSHPDVAPVYVALSAALGVDSATLPKLSHIFDTAVTHFCHDATLRAGETCINATLIRDIRRAVDASSQATIDDDESFLRFARLKMAPLLREIAERIERKMKTAIEDEEPRFLLYSGHDSTIDPLAVALGVADGKWPRYAARIVVELYGRGGDAVKKLGEKEEQFIRVLRDGVLVTGRTEYCAGRLVDPLRLGMCPASMFVKFAKEGLMRLVGDRNYEQACEKSIDGP